MAPRFIITTGLMLVLAAGVQADPPKDAKDSIKNAIKAGRAYLENAYRPGGPGGGPPLPGDIARIPGVDKMMPFGHQIGSACLAGLAILEAGGSADNPAVANIAGTTRKVALSVTSTYELSLMIMFFDRLGSKADQPLIQFLTLRLLSGQCADGSWAYVCNGIQLDPVQERQLAAELVKEARLTTPDEPRPGAKKKDARPREDIDFGTPKKDKPKEEPKEKPKPKEEKKGLHPALEKFVGVAPAPGNIGPPGGGRNIPIPGEFGRQHTGDHSNTQFATVGLWCGRRHYVDVSAALSLLDQHYRKVQNNQDGGWSYTQSGGSSTAAMTCAGLMGLAMGFGAKNLDATGDLRAAAQDEFAKDLAVANGLKFLGNILAAGPALNMASGDHVAPGVQPGMNYYFMWSLERVGMVYGLTTIGKVDWYEWGAEGIVKSQRRDGSWHSNDFHSGSPENSTSFALLFLCRANLADDLSTSLKGKVKDPGTSRLVRSSDLSKYIGGSGSSGSSGPKRPDPGPSTPRPKVETPSPATDKATKLADALVAASGAEREELIRVYRESKGSEYTDALAKAAAKLTGDAQAKVREALAGRLIRMNAATLNDLMTDRDPELRRGAALAAGAKGKERLGEFAEKLIGLISDRDGVVVQAARASLKALSGQDFGPEPGADRGQAQVAWKKWWKEQK